MALATSYNESAEKYGISKSSISRWVKNTEMK